MRAPSDISKKIILLLSRKSGIGTPAGRYRRAFTSYNERNVPVDVRIVVKNLYGNFSVLSASGLDDGGKMSYNVIIENEEFVRVLVISGPTVKILDQYQYNGHDVSRIDR